ncbi:GMC oxidoreductase [Nakamurella endophytica]|uniref:Pyranose oxidase n=1 Tax=Nakamurella endophytica TaxID=1748367 RepID=A0A917WDJ1_9ACTN|nr:GMC oxidoreductase [Nakamurella endophytica]GGL94451.1 pyranose oxidase [Nakamurella endophytica]
MNPEWSEHVDVLVVGSGPAGAAYARTIRNGAPTAVILMVEAGPVIAEPPGLHVANILDPQERARAQVASQGPDTYPYPLTWETASEQDREQALLQRPGLFRVGSGPLSGNGFPAAQAASNVGGMGSHWFGCCPRPSDTERIPFLDAGELDAAFEVAERYLQVSATQFADSAFAAHVRERVGGVVDEGRPAHRRVQAMPMAVRLTDHGVERSGPNVILGDLLSGADPSFELRARTLCRRVILDGERACGVELEDLETGAVRRVSADVVVVAGDSLRTPQLLFASGVRPPALGRHLNEHPQVSVMARVHGAGDTGGRSREQGETAVMANTAAVSVAASGVTWIPYDAKTFPAHGNLVQVDPASLPGPQADDPTPVLSVHLFLPQEVRPENAVEFDDERTDWLGMPAMRMHVDYSTYDLEVIENAKADALRIAWALGAPFEGEDPWVLPAGSSLHYEGTVRMGPVDDGTSVCDSTSRVWGTDNLYVGGNGVIPLTTACNPTLTTVALAVLAGQHIAATLATAG